MGPNQWFGCTKSDDPTLVHDQENHNGSLVVVVVVVAVVVVVVMMILFCFFAYSCTVCRLCGNRGGGKWRREWKEG